MCRECPAPCLASCADQLIRRHPADHEHSGQPYLDLSRAGCTFCGDCTTACPQTDRALEKVGLAKLDQAQCTAWNAVICVSCRGICSAIQVDLRGRPSIEDEACTGCGICISRCPVEAFEVTVRGVGERER